MKYGHRPAVILVALATFGGLAGCSAPENTLASHLGSPLDSFPGIADDVYTLSLTQDDRLGSLPREANQVDPAEDGWVIAAICADTLSISPEETRNVTLRVIAKEFIDDEARERISRGDYQDGVVCGNAASIAPELAEG